MFQKHLSVMWLLHLGDILVAIDFFILLSCCSTIARVNFRMHVTILSIDNMLPRVPTLENQK